MKTEADKFDGQNLGAIQVGDGLRVVRRIVRPHRVPLTVSVAGSLLFALGSVVSTVVLARVIDQVALPAFEDGADQADRRQLWLGVAAVMAIAMVRSIGVVSRRFFAGLTAERVQRTTRDRLADEYLDRPASWVRTQPAGRLLAHVDNDAKVLVEALHPLPFSIAVVFLALFSAVALLLVDPVMAGLAFVVFPLVTMLNRWYSRLVREPLAETQERVGEVSSIAHESFEGSLIVKALGLADREAARFDEASAGLQKARVNVGFLRAIVDALLDALPVVGTLLAVVLAAFRVRAGAMSAGEVVQVAALFSLLAVPVRVFGFFLESLAPSVVSWRRLSPFLAGDPTPTASVVTSVASPISTGGADPVVVSNLSYLHPEGAAESGFALDSISFSINRGEVVAVVGRTGSGKSLLCLLLAGLLEPSEGDIETGGVPPILAFQESFLFADTLRANIDLADQYEDATVHSAAKAAQIATFIESLPHGYDTVVGERGVTLSGGQRQRIALARALLVNQGFLIVDDATSAIDPVVEQRILEALRAKTATTVVLTAHRLSTIRMADRVLYLEEGLLRGFGSHAELLTNDEYRSLVMAYGES